MHRLRKKGRGEGKMMERENDRENRLSEFPEFYLLPMSPFASY